MNQRERADLLAGVGKLCPEVRFGQLIANLAVVARGTEPGAVRDMEDDELREAVKWQLAQLAARRTGVA